MRNIFLWLGFLLLLAVPTVTSYRLANEGRLLSRESILAAVWGADYEGTDRTVDNFVNRLRTKIEPDPASPSHLVTVRGGGYRFQRG